MDEEVWKPVLGYEGMYEVSSHGRVRNVASMCFIKPVWNGRKGNEYLYFGVRKHGKKGNLLLSGMVCAVFNGKRPDGYHAAHKDGDRSNNRADNLRWLSPKQNIAEKKLHGTEPLGEARHISKLTDEAVRYIRANYQKGSSQFGLTALAKKFGVAPNAIKLVVIGRTWRHVS